MQRAIAAARQTVLRASSARSSVTAVRYMSGAKKTIKVTFVKPDGSKKVVDAPVGDSMLEVAHANGVDIEGACGGETACSTCHVIVDPAFFKKLPEMSEAEEDMLDLAAGLTDTSRLGCQVFAAAELDGLIVNLPKEVNNMMSK